MRSIRLASLVNELLISFKENMSSINLTPSKIQGIVREWLQNELNRWEARRLEYLSEGCQLPFDSNPDDWDKIIQRLEAEARVPNRETGVEPDEETPWKQISVKASELLRSKGIEIQPNTVEYNALCLELLRARVQWARIEKKRASGEDYAFPTGISTRQESERSSGDGVSLSEAIEKYIQVKSDSEDWGEKSVIEIPPHLREFVEIVEHGQGACYLIALLDRDVMRAYKSILCQLPPKRTIIQKYRDKSLQELVEADTPVMSPKTIKNKLTIVRSFLTWAKDEGYISDAETLKRAIPDPKQAVKAGQSTRQPFSSADIDMMFSPESYLGDKKITQAVRFWGPLIALHTGARIEEICQLTLEDIHQEEEIWVFDINDKADKHVKSEAGKRVVPVHPVLIELGLLERVEYLKSSGFDRLFPNLTPNKKGVLSDGLSKWFTRFRRDMGIGDEQGKKFHSFRHTFATECKRRGVERRMVKEVIGHEAGDKDDVTDIYEHGYPVSTLFEEVVCKLDFLKPDCIEGLKRNKWIQAI